MTHYHCPDWALPVADMPDGFPTQDTAPDRHFEQYTSCAWWCRGSTWVPGFGVVTWRWPRVQKQRDRRLEGTEWVYHFCPKCYRGSVWRSLVDYRLSVHYHYSRWWEGPETATGRPLPILEAPGGWRPGPFRSVMWPVGSWEPTPQN